MKISVITPSYNQGRFIRKCLESVKAQSGAFKIEHIILDNCSTDDTAHHLSFYEANCGTVEVRVFTEPDEGQTQAINRGFERATGDVICWLNTDEWYENGAISKVVHHFASDPTTGAVFGDCHFVDSSGRLMKTRQEGAFSMPMLLYYGCYLPSCATFVRRDFFERGVRLDESFKVTMDYDWYVRLAAAGCRFEHIRDVLASFMWHESNVSNVLATRRASERRMVQDQHCGWKKLGSARFAVYEVFRQYWRGVRVMRRLARAK